MPLYPFAAEFVWNAASKEGYRWALDRDGQPYLDPTPDTLEKRYLPLLQETGLFLNLADTEPSPDGILGFANRYGFLGKGVYEVYTLSEEEKERFGFSQESRKALVGLPRETLRAWQGAIVWLRYAVDLWTAARQNSREKLERFVVAGKRRVLIQEIPYLRSTEFKDTFAYEPIFLEQKGIETSDLAGIGLYFLHELLASALRGLVTTTVRWSSEERRPVLATEVESLWGAILLQFVDAISSENRFQRCPVCSRWFEVGAGGSRVDRMTCSDSCRQKQYRQRKEKAVELRQAGKPLREIAEEVGSDVATVKGWLKED